MRLLNKLFDYVLITTKYFNIDESHGVSHSMEVLNFTYKIFSGELARFPQINQNKKIIYSSAILHDMCDKKYMDEKEGFNRITQHFINDFTPVELDGIEKIITTMSYSKVKKNGFPQDLGYLELPYHIVREADLLSAYDFNRCVIYDLYVGNNTLHNSLHNSNKLYKNRIMNYYSDNLFVTNTGKLLAKELETKSIEKLTNWNHIIEFDKFI